MVNNNRMKEIKLGIVGFGSRGEAMLKTALDMPNVVLAGVCDSSNDKLDKAKSIYPDACFDDDYEHFLQHVDIDALLVETPGDNHARFCAMALHKNLNVISDVPCVFDYDEAEMLWQAEKTSDAMFMFGANPNMWGFVQSAVDLYEQGQLGKPILLEAEYLHDVRSLFKSTPWRSKFPPIKYCTHSLGPLLRIVREDIISVSCFATGSEISGLKNYHDTMIANFKTASNILINIKVSFANNYKGGHHSYRIFGTEGYFERFSGRGETCPPFTIFNSTTQPDTEKITKIDVNELHPKFADIENTGHGGADYVLLYRFFEAIRNNLPSPIPLREGLRMSLPGIFAAESAEKNGELTTVKYPWTN